MITALLYGRVLLLATLIALAAAFVWVSLRTGGQR
jgi:hypothetical protein